MPRRLPNMGRGNLPLARSAVVIKRPKQRPRWQRRGPPSQPRFGYNANRYSQTRVRQETPETCALGLWGGRSRSKRPARSKPSTAQAIDRRCVAGKAETQIPRSPVQSQKSLGPSNSTFSKIQILRKSLVIQSRHSAIGKVSTLSYRR